MDSNTTENREIETISQAQMEAALQEFETSCSTVPETIHPSRQYRRWFQRMVRDPASFAQEGQDRNTGRQSPWKRVCQTAACFVLLFGLSIAFSPTARAWVASWLVEQESTHDTYYFAGQQENASSELLAWEPAYLPDGYEQEAYDNLTSVIDIRYGSVDGNSELWIDFSYMRMEEGSSWGIDNEHNTKSEIQINGMAGALYTAEGGTQNMLVWFDTNAGYTFFLSSKLPIFELIDMAESVQIAQN